MGILKDLKIKDIATLGGTICGVISVVISVEGKTSLLESGYSYFACLFIFLAAIMDFIDGFLARKFKQVNQLGVELDSLNDSFCFGVAPALLVYCAYTKDIIHSGINGEIAGFLPFVLIFPVIIFIIGAIVRLAWFNIDEGEGYTGLVTPISAFVVISLHMADVAWYHIPSDFIVPLIPYTPLIVYIFPFTLCFLAYLNVTPYLVYGKVIRKKTGPLKYILVTMGILFLTAILMGVIALEGLAFFINVISLTLFGFIVVYVLYGLRNWIIERSKSKEISG